MLCHTLCALRAEAALAHALAHKPRMHSRTKKSCTSACCATLCGRCVLKLRWRMHSRTNRACTRAQIVHALTHKEKLHVSMLCHTLCALRAEAALAHALAHKPRMHSRTNRASTHTQTAHALTLKPHMHSCTNMPHARQYATRLQMHARTLVKQRNAARMPHAPRAFVLLLLLRLLRCTPWRGCSTTPPA
jgi:hypothetical protein